MALIALPLTGMLAAAEPTLVLLGQLKVDGVDGTEILSVHAPSRRIAVTCSDAGAVAVLDASDPSQPKQVALHALGLAQGEEITCVAIHPDGKRFVVAIKAGPSRPGRAEVRGLADNALLATIEAGFGPDHVAISADGSVGLVCNEAEEAVLAKDLTSPPGSLTVPRFVGDAVTGTQIALDDLSTTKGLTQAEAGRFIEREVTHDGAGTTDFRGHEVALDGKVALVPLVDGKADLLEPECSVISADGSTAWVTLQENNAVLRVDLAQAKVVAVAGLGTTTHPADLKEDGTAAFTSTLVALREPDGIALTVDGRYLVTADEGDTDPKASKIKAGKPAGGGRTVTVIDAATLAVLGDTGGGIDAAAADAGCYPDKRSPNKGSEPESVATFVLGGIPYAVAGLERADAVALIALADPAKPQVLSVLPLGKEHKAPEGIATVTWDDRVHVLVANEKSGTVCVLAIQP